jgi:hypothetical protein
MKTGTSGGTAPPFLTTTLDGGEQPVSRPGRFTPRDNAPVPVEYDVWTL